MYIFMNCKRPDSAGAASLAAILCFSCLNICPFLRWLGKLFIYKLYSSCLETRHFEEKYIFKLFDVQNHGQTHVFFQSGNFME